MPCFDAALDQMKADCTLIVHETEGFLMEEIRLASSLPIAADVAHYPWHPFHTVQECGRRSLPQTNTSWGLIQDTWIWADSGTMVGVVFVRVIEHVQEAQVTLDEWEAP